MAKSNRPRKGQRRVLDAAHSASEWCDTQLARDAQRALFDACLASIRACEDYIGKRRQPSPLDALSGVSPPTESPESESHDARRERLALPWNVSTQDLSREDRWIAANAELCVNFVDRRWLPASIALRVFYRADDIRELTPPEGPCASVHSIFASFLENPVERSEIAARELAGVRSDFFLYRYKIADYFRWLRGALFAPQNDAQALNSEVDSNATDGAVTHTQDFSTLVVRGTPYVFQTTLQRAIIEALFDERASCGDVDGCGLHVAKLVDVIEHSKRTHNLRVDKVFAGHPALHTILRTIGPGIWALMLSGDGESSLFREDTRRTPDGRGTDKSGSKTQRHESNQKPRDVAGTRAPLASADKVAAKRSRRRKTS